MAKTPSRHVNFASKTVEARDGNSDEILNEDLSHARLIFMSTAHMGTARQRQCSGDVCFPG